MNCCYEFQVVILIYYNIHRNMRVTCQGKNTDKFNRRIIFVWKFLEMYSDTHIIYMSMAVLMCYIYVYKPKVLNNIITFLRFKYHRYILYYVIKLLIFGRYLLPMYYTTTCYPYIVLKSERFDDLLAVSKIKTIRAYVYIWTKEIIIYYYNT